LSSPGSSDFNFFKDYADKDNEELWIFNLADSFRRKVKVKRKGDKLIRVDLSLETQMQSRAFFNSWFAGALTSVVLAGAVTGCLQPGSGNYLATTSSTLTSTAVPAGAKAFQVVLGSGASGSFTETTPTNGTAPGAGLAAVQLFDPKDGVTVLANGTTDPNWPAWLYSVTLGISGTTNTSAPNPNCATFASANEESQSNCNYGNGNVSCGASAGQFRVSEVDCGYGAPATTNGNGGGGDGVYIQAYFNRAHLGPTENIMVVVNYIASTYNAGANTLPAPVPAPATPSCFSNGAFSPASCADFTWQMYMKHSPTEVVQPFMAFVPPIYNYASSSASTSPTWSTKQFIVPFSGDQNLNTIQFSRVTSLLNSAPNTNTTTYLSACDAGVSRTSGGADSPKCAGIIFKSITFFRI
jgi:hypothetical protein